MHYYLDIGCDSAHGKQRKSWEIVVVSKGSTFEKPLLKNPIPIFVEDFDNLICELSLLNKDTPTCSQLTCAESTEVFLETNQDTQLDIPHVADKQLELQDVIFSGDVTIPKEASMPTLNTSKQMGQLLETITQTHIDMPEFEEKQVYVKDCHVSANLIGEKESYTPMFYPNKATELILVTTPEKRLDLEDVGYQQLDLQDVDLQMEYQDVGAQSMDLQDVGGQLVDLQDVGDQQVDSEDVGDQQLDADNINAINIDFLKPVARHADNCVTHVIDEQDIVSLKKKKIL